MAEKMADLTLAQLKDKAVNLGFKGDIKSYNSKAQVQGVIDILVNQTPVDKEHHKEVDKLEVKPVDVGGGVIGAEIIDNKQSDEKRHKTKADIMRDKLNAQEKVQVFLSLEHGEQVGSVEETEVNGRRVTKTSGTVEKFTTNGYKTYVPKGIPFLVPKQIAKRLGQSQVDTANAGKNISIDRDRDVKDALT